MTTICSSAHQKSNGKWIDFRAFIYPIASVIVLVHHLIRSKRVILESKLSKVHLFTYPLDGRVQWISHFHDCIVLILQTVAKAGTGVRILGESIANDQRHVFSISGGEPRA